MSSHSNDRPGSVPARARPRRRRSQTIAATGAAGGVAVAGIAALLFSGGIGTASAAGSPQAATGGAAAAGAAASIACPAVEPALAGVAIPASARAEVDRNLALLRTQIGEANTRLVTTRGQGGPNFVRNAILGPLGDKRFATLNRIATAIGRQGVRPEGLDRLSECALDGAAAAGGAAGGGVAGGGAAPTGVAAGASTTAATATGAATGGAAAAGAAASIACPAVEPALAGVAIPASARAEVDRNLALLRTQIGEANTRLVTTRGQGGPNFVRNAILGPLADKRFATLNRIETAIGRQGVRPEGLEVLATCRLAN